MQHSEKIHHFNTSGFIRLVWFHSREPSAQWAADTLTPQRLLSFELIRVTLPELIPTSQTDLCFLYLPVAQLQSVFLSVWWRTSSLSLAAGENLLFASYWEQRLVQEKKSMHEQNVLLWLSWWKGFASRKTDLVDSKQVHFGSVWTVVGKGREKFEIYLSRVCFCDHLILYLLSSASLRLDLLLDCRPMAQICLVNESPLTHWRHDRLCHAFIRSRHQQPRARSRRLPESWHRLHAAEQMPRHNKWIPSNTE